MSMGRKIVDYAATLFDVVGTVRSAGQGELLILGLESTPERNLDDFERRDGETQLTGFEKYAKPRLEILVDFIREQGFPAEPLGKFGYPRQGEANLKELAVSAGLGKRGKSTVVLHPHYGTRLRFMAVKTDAPLETDTIPHQPETENPVCRDCMACLEACPLYILEPYRMTDTSRCLSNTTNMPEAEGRLVPCDLCLRVCPAD
jgi:epoxyqueuosine reductase QueG